MKSIQLKLVMIAFLSFAFAISSCKKDENSQIEITDTSTSQYDALAESIITDVGDMIDEAYNLSLGNYKSTEDDTIILGPCATITLDTVVFPHELIIDFGEENCLCRDGRYRRGKIINTFTGRYLEPGTILTHSFDEYFVNDNKVEGSRVVTNMGYNTNENLYFTIEVEILITLAEKGVTFGWNASRVREWAEGADTPQRWDDVFLLTGTAEGIRPSGLNWTREIIIPLRREVSCRYIVSGSVQIEPEGKPVRLLDYGDGECDNIATVTINGKTFTIYLR